MNKPKPMHPWRAFNPGWLQRTDNEKKLEQTHRKVLRK